MSKQRESGPFSKTISADEGVHHVIFEQAYKRTQCNHNLEFWVAVKACHSGEPVIIQWCMRCQASEVLTWEDYEQRKSTRLLSDHECDNQNDWFDALQ
ncbi:MAG: hypothetical protein HOH43_18205 [Candidatus Latescibacteria bacterium]|nr:hypothetical protein [Candidatus Latescibacterota bacterium]